MADVEKYLGKNVIAKISNNQAIEGKVIGVIPAVINEPEIDEINILNNTDNKNYSFFMNEIMKIKIVD